MKCSAGRINTSYATLQGTLVGLQFPASEEINPRGYPLTLPFYKLRPSVSAAEPPCITCITQRIETRLYDGRAHLICFCRFTSIYVLQI